MRNIIITILLLSGLFANAQEDLILVNNQIINNEAYVNSTPTPVVADYYVSADGTGNGLSESTPMSFASMESTLSSMSSGDVIALKGGDDFYENLTLSSLTGLTFTSYGTGQANITGEKSATGWTNTSGNIWRYDAGTSTVYHVSVDDTWVANGRLPVVSDIISVHDNLFNVDSHSGLTVIQNDNLIGAPDLAGAKVFYNKNTFSISTYTVDSFNSTTGAITLTSAVGEVKDDKSSFWVCNHPNLLSKQNDWYWDDTNNYLYMYSVGTPTNVKIITDDLGGVGIQISGCTSITLDNIKVSGYYEVGIDLNATTTNTVIENSTISKVIQKGIDTWDGDNLTIDSCIIEEIQSSATYLVTTNSTVTNNTVRNIGVQSQMSYTEFVNTSNTGSGIITFRDNTLVQYNHVENIGRMGINARGNAIIDKNFVKNALLTSQDGGCIYTAYNSTYPNPNMDITNNIVEIDYDTKKSYSSIYFWEVNGIYTDDGESTVDVKNNTVIGANRGIFCHNSQYMTYDNNNTYLTEREGLLFRSDGIVTQDSEFNISTNNNIYNESTFSPVKIWDGRYNDNLMLATSNNNNYFNPNISTSVMVMLTNVAVNDDVNDYTLSQWQTLSGLDTNSTEDSNNVTDSQIIYNATKSAVAKTIVGTWYELDGTSHTSTVTLQPYEGMILIQN